jgi:hypothetical protein
MDNRNRLPQDDARLEAARRLAERERASAQWRRAGRRNDPSLRPATGTRAATDPSRAAAAARPPGAASLA